MQNINQGRLSLGFEYWQGCCGGWLLVEGRSARCGKSNALHKLLECFWFCLHEIRRCIMACPARRGDCSSCNSERLHKDSSVALRCCCMAAVHAADLRAGDVWSHCHRLLHHRHSWAHCACGEEFQDLLCCQASQVIPCDSF